MEGGQLFDQIVKQDFITQIKTANIIQQILSALAYCNLKGVIHRDIKPQNILLETKKNDSNCNTNFVKLCDFGLAKRLSSDTQTIPTHLVGSPLYMAPEVIKEECVNYKSDIWSVGVIMYIMLSGYPPFFAQTRQQLFDLVTKSDISFSHESWNHISQEAKDMIKSMLQKNYNNRKSARALLKHPWFKKCSQESHSGGAFINVKSMENSLKALKKFNTKNQLYQASMMYITSQLISNQEKRELRDAFFLIDSSKDGQISREQLISAFKTRPNLRRNFGDNEIDQIINAIDLDKDGMINYTQFINATIDKNKALSLRNIQLAFQLFDANGDGFISLQELKDALSGIQGDAMLKKLVIQDKQQKQEKKKVEKDPNEQENKTVEKGDIWKNLLQECDSNKDGKIQFSQFKKMLSKCL